MRPPLSGFYISVELRILDRVWGKGGQLLSPRGPGLKNNIVATPSLQGGVHTAVGQHRRIALTRTDR